MASTVALVRSAVPATASIFQAAPMSAASSAAASASSQRPLSTHAHCMTESAAPLAPRTPGARSRPRSSRSTSTASSFSSRCQAAPASLAGSQTGPPATRRRRATASARSPNGSVHDLIHSASSSTGTSAAATSRASRAARTFARAPDRPVWWTTMAASAVASHAIAGLPSDAASAATETRVSRASPLRFDHSSDQPMCRRASSRRSGSDVSVRTSPAISHTQSACPARLARSQADSSRRTRSAGTGLSWAARSSARAAAATPPRRRAWSALPSSNVATCSSGSSAAAARCQARRSG